MAVSTVVLVLVTTYYALISRRILNETAKQSRLALNPVIGIEVNSIRIGPVFGHGRRNMGVALTLTNVGNAPAISIKVDAEIKLKYTSINGEHVIPARFEPDVHPFLRPGDVIKEIKSSFGNDFIGAFLRDIKEKYDLNTDRIKKDPTQEAYTGPQLRLFVYYRNSLGQFFKSKLECHVGIFARNGEYPIPGDDERAGVSQYYVPRPIFNAGPYDEVLMFEEIEKRNPKRAMCGW